MDLTIAEISRIKTGTPAEKRRLLEHFLSTRTSAGIQLSLDALGDPDWTIRRFAADALAKMGPSALEHLGKALRSGDENQRYWAVQSLVGVGRDAVPLLLKILARGPKTMRLHAASALGQIGDPTAIPYLVQALGDETWPVRFHAFEGLVEFGERALAELTKGIQSDNEDRAYWSAKALGKLGEKAREVLLAALKGGNRRLRFVVAAALGETGDRRVIRVLIHSTKDKSWIVRRRASDALAEIGPTAIPLLLEALAEDDPEQAEWLLSALCKMGEAGQAALLEVLVSRGESFAWNVRDPLVNLGNAARPLFLALARHEDLDLRFFSATCLGMLPPHATVDQQLVECLKDPSWSIRKVAAEALSQRGAAIRETLTRAMEYGNEDLRYWVTVVFRKMGAEGVDLLVDALQDSNSNVAYFAASALAEVREARVIRPLIRTLASDSWPVRNAASTSLSLLGALSVEQLVNSIEDEHEDVAFWVTKTLRRLGRAALPEVVRLLKKGSDEQRFYAAKTLGALKDPSAVPALIAALKDGHEWVRLYAAIALGETGGEEALTHLLEMLKDPTFRIHPKMVSVFEGFGERAVPDLMAMAKTGEPSARANALHVLGALKVDAAFPLIAEAAGDEGSDRELRLAGLQAMGGFGHQAKAVTVLAEVAAQGEPPSVRNRAIVVLAELESDDAVLALLKAHAAGEGRDDQGKISGLLKEKGPPLLPTLIAALAHSDVGVRKAAAEVLELFGGASLPYVRSALNEPDQNVRFWAKKLAKKLEDQVVS